MAADQDRSNGEPQVPGTDDEALAQLIKNGIRDVPDYPRAGILFKDITPLLGDATTLRLVVDALGTGFGPIDKVAGIEARGFILAAPVACQLGAGFVPVRKQGNSRRRPMRRATSWNTGPPRSRCTRTRHTGGAGPRRR